MKEKRGEMSQTTFLYKHNSISSAVQCGAVQRELQYK